ncbi:MAG: hypothetical protein HN392_14015 [Anaerolineae bacterium]|nr:hypothetical protein [Anaerolineae bacterium]MBT7074441.1 hypothetical protein [Anaerolineae bacterium]
MNAKQELFQLMGEVSGTIFPLGREVVMSLFEKYFTEQRFYALTFMASNIAPKSISVTLLSKRTPYGNPESYKTALADAVESDYLEADDAGGYVISEKGKLAIEESHAAFYKHINEVSQFPAERMGEIAVFLQKLVVASMASTQAKFTSGTVALDISHGGHPDVESGTLAEVDQCLDDLNAFRDDAHIAAWTPSGVSGYVWEALSFVWNGEANTAEKLVERLSFRNYAAEDYAIALAELQELGWIEPSDDGFVATAAGRKVREDGEAKTNELYFAPWSVLSDGELTRLGGLLTELKESNEKLLPAAE